jgi:hypothetical protein
LGKLCDGKWEVFFFDEEMRTRAETLKAQPKPGTLSLLTCSSKLQLQTITIVIRETSRISPEGILSHTHLSRAIIVIVLSMFYITVFHWYKKHTTSPDQDLLQKFSVSKGTRVPLLRCKTSQFAHFL